MDTDVATTRNEDEPTLEDCDRSELASFVLWLLEAQSVTPSEVARMIEKPRAYGNWFAVYHHRGSLDTTLAGPQSSHRAAVRMSSRALTPRTRLSVLP